MARRIHTSAQIIHKLREAEVLLAQGQSVQQSARQIEVTEQTYYRWRKEYGGLRVNQAKRREVVQHLCTTLEISQRRACTVLGVPRSTHHYRPISPADEAGVSATYGLSWPRSMAGMVIDELPHCYSKKDSRSIIREWSVCGVEKD
jgi:hypothetical protein